MKRAATVLALAVGGLFTGCAGTGGGEAPPPAIELTDGATTLAVPPRIHEGDALALTFEIRKYQLKSEPKCVRLAGVAVVRTSQDTLVLTCPVCEDLAGDRASISVSLPAGSLREAGDGGGVILMLTASAGATLQSADVVGSFHVRIPVVKGD